MLTPMPASMSHEYGDAFIVRLLFFRQVLARSLLNFDPSSEDFHFMNDTLRVLHLEDDHNDAELVRLALRTPGLKTDISVARNAAQFEAAMELGKFDLVLSDSSIPGFDGLAALRRVREKDRGLPFIFVSGYGEPGRAERLKAAGATDYVPKNRLAELHSAVRRALPAGPPAALTALETYLSGMERLIGVGQELARARSLESIMTIVSRAARELTGADGATFILRDGDQCHYADEDAIAPLWKGSRFPISACIAGWTMLHRTLAVIGDISTDPRISPDAYRATCVKSLVMVPIRTEEPIGAIGAYWAAPHRATPGEVKLLKSLAQSAAVAMENVQAFSDLDECVQERTAQLEAASKDIEAFSHSVSHDLRAPLRNIEVLTHLLKAHRGVLDETESEYFNEIAGSTQRMSRLIEDLLNLAGLGRVPLRKAQVDLGEMAREIFSELRASAPERNVETVIGDGLTTVGDPGLLRIALENLLSNAWKYTSRRAHARIELGHTTSQNGEPACFIRDNGAGFDPQYVGRLFGVFQRLHSESEFPGTGVGLATVQRIMHRHGGRIWAKAALDEGATFFFTLR
jgi:signal transduction histidine kinase/CheY-like chemotaxis protein